MPKVSFENKIKVDLHVRTQQENKQTIWEIVNFMTL